MSARFPKGWRVVTRDENCGSCGGCGEDNGGFDRYSGEYVGWECPTCRGAGMFVWREAVPPRRRVVRDVVSGRVLGRAPEAA